MDKSNLTFRHYSALLCGPTRLLYARGILLTMSLISSVVVTVRYLNDSTSICIQRRVFIIRGIRKRVERFELVRQLADVFESIPEAAGISVGLLLSLSLSFPAKGGRC